jgi:CBS domain containing-hemolysin-like protein
VSVRRTRIAELVARGEAGAEAVQRAIENPDRVIAATQLGITLSSLALGWVGEPALSHYILPVVSLFPKVIQPDVSHSISAILAFGIITFLHVVVGELAPKSIALQNPERTSLVVAGPTLFTERLFKPVIWALNGTGNALLKLVGVKPASGHELVHSVEELKMIVSASAEEGLVHEEEHEMLNAIFDLGELVVRQIMVPRTEMIAIEADTPLDEMIGAVRQTTFTKFPVFENNLDQVIGILHVRDLFNALTAQDCEHCVARDFTRETLFIPETLHVGGLLRLFRAKRQHVAIVLDEFGGTAGIATLEDLLEEIVGEVSDQFDQGMPGFETLPDGSILVDGLTQLEDVNEQLGLNLREPYYDTIAGYVMGKLGRMPHQNDVVEGEKVRLKVVEMDGRRVSRVSLTIKGAPPAPSLPPEAQS